MRQRLAVFSQGTLDPDEDAVVRAAATHFATQVAFVSRHHSEDGARLVATLADARFAIDVRAANEADWARADHAAIAGRAGGMDRLARRCRVVWIVSSDASEAIVWTFAAILASSLLGPVMPDDASTLVGVRGARLRAG